MTSAQTHNSGDAGTADFSHRFARFCLSRGFALTLAGGAMLSGIATYAAITGAMQPNGPNPKTILVLLNVDLVLLLLLGALVSWRLVRLWIARRQGSVGSRLHTRMVALFSLVAIAPAIVVALFSVAFLHFGLQAWFNERVSTALDRSVAVAEAYLKDHRGYVRADVLSMVNAINRVAPRLVQSPEALNALLEELVTERSLAEALIVRGDGTVLASSRFAFMLSFGRVPLESLQRAGAGDVVILTSESQERIRAIARIDSMVGAFLYVSRFVDAEVLGHLSRLTSAVDDYQQLETRREGIQITFTMLFVIVALLLLLAAVWVGLTFATRLVRPISSLVAAAERVRTGDLSQRVEEGHDDDEIATLSRAFNRMMGQLSTQRSELVEANRQLDGRRRFTETVLAGVSAGVLGLDPSGRIFLPNRSALELLSCRLDDLAGRALEAAVPEMADLMDEVRGGAERMVQDQVSVARGDRTRALLVRITVEREGLEVRGYVVTFEDVTELINAQRAAAWSDVARRIAHEIKNPLTPIQLAAERLKRKYHKEIKTDPEVFVTCVETIVRQVADMRRMVDEFSSFSRMPAPVRVREDIVEIVQRAVSMQHIAHADIDFSFESDADQVSAYCDSRQLGQAVTNLLQNALDAIHALGEEDERLDKGRITIRVSHVDSLSVRIEITDNGRGLPKELRDRLVEPYVTTRTRGTGLGLAIVKKIMEDHGGELEMTDAPGGGGARVTLILPGEAIDSDRAPGS